MSLALAGSLIVLALIDSTSFGTLLIPIWLLVMPGRVQAPRVLVFLGTVAGFYFVVGVALMLGADRISDAAPRLLEHQGAVWAQLVLGLGLLIGSFFIGRKRNDGSPGRLLRWRDRAMSSETGTRSLVALGLTAATIEVASMLPYLGAIGLLATSSLTIAGQVGVLAGYCLVMIAPASVLLALRLTMHDRIDPLLRRIAAWIERNAGETTAWIVGIVGFLLARDAAVRIQVIVDYLERI